MPLSTDHPILDLDDDRLGRKELVRALAGMVVDTPAAKDGFVVGLGGRWGSGKTSVLELVTAEAKLRDPEILLVRFNPWLFADAEELVVRFCLELATQISEAGGSAVKTVTDQLLGLGKLVGPLNKIPGLGLPTAGVEAAAKVAEVFGLGSDQSAAGRHKAVRKALLELDRRVLVVIDDVDRLSDAEIREVARVVKLVGDLPNVVYLLAYDRARVERALGGPGDRAEGRAYIEKIVQVTHDLPEAPVSALRALLEEGVAEVLGASIGDAAKRLRRGWPYIGRRVRTVRDVRRLLNVLPITLALLGGEVAIEDVVCLEVMRLLDLEGWEQLPAMARLLTSAPILASLEDQPSRQKRLTAWVQEPAEAGGGSEPSHARHALLDCLFPVGVAGLKGLTDATVAAAHEQSPRWRAEGRVATGRFLALYLSGTRSDGGLARSTVVEVVRRLSANDPLAELGEDMSERQVGELLVELNYRLDELDEGSLELTARELSLLVDRRTSRAGSRSVPLGDGFDLARVVGGLAMKVADEGERSTRLDAIARSLPLSGWMAFIGFFATSDDGHERTFSPLIDRPTSLRLKEDHRAAVAAASAEVLATERRLDRLIAVLLALPDGVQRLQALAAADGFLPALLASMVDEFRPGSKSLALPWRWLVERLGETLAARVLALEADGGAERSPSEAEAVTLAARYALGESLHDTSPRAQPDEAADGDEADPPAANERGDQ